MLSQIARGSVVDNKAETVSALNANTVSSKDKTPGGGGGCTIGTSNDIDFSLPLFLLLSLFYLFKRNKQVNRRA